MKKIDRALTRLRLAVIADGDLSFADACKIMEEELGISSAEAEALMREFAQRMATQSEAKPSL